MSAENMIQHTVQLLDADAVRREPNSVGVPQVCAIWFDQTEASYYVTVRSAGNKVDEVLRCRDFFKARGKYNELRGVDYDDKIDR